MAKLVYVELDDPAVRALPPGARFRAGDCVGSEKAPGASLTVSAFCDLIDFIASDLWASVVNDDSLSGMDSRDFAAMEGLTKLTQPGLEVV